MFNSVIIITYLSHYIDVVYYNINTRNKVECSVNSILNTEHLPIIIIICNIYIATYPAR